MHHGTQRLTALIADASGYRSLCRILSLLQLSKPASLAALLAQHTEGLHLLCAAPVLLKPPLLDSFGKRLWLEVVRPGQTQAAEQALLEGGLRLGLKPVASLAVRFAVPGISPPSAWLRRCGKRSADRSRESKERPQPVLPVK